MAFEEWFDDWGWRIKDDLRPITDETRARMRLAYVAGFSGRRDFAPLVEACEKLQVSGITSRHFDENEAIIVAEFDNALKAVTDDV